MTYLKLLVGTAVLTATLPVMAEDAFYEVPLSQLLVTDGGPVPDRVEATGRPWHHLRILEVHARLDGQGEAYMQSTDQGRGSWRAVLLRSNMTLLVRSPKKGDVTGHLVLPRTEDGKPGKAQVVRFRVPAARASAEAKSAFFQAKENHYKRLLQRDIPGAAWFRHQATTALQQRVGADGQVASRQRINPIRRRGTLADSYRLFSGGRAISENLQLDRVLGAAADKERKVKTDDIPGITVRAYDFAALVKDKKVASDALAAFIPSDQPAAFFSKFANVMRVRDEIEYNGSLVLGMAEPRSERANVMARYEKQLCLPATELARQMGPHLVKSLALTASDPYFPTGTDVAVLFEAKSATILEGFLGAQQALAKQNSPQAQLVSGEVEGVTYRGLVTPDRTICAYLVTLGNVVAVTNSKHQLEQLVRVHRGSIPALSSLDEYHFFRDRYKLNDEKETAFVVLTDATIRRWCSPRWRIGASRRLQAGAVLAHYQARNADDLLRGKLGGGELEGNLQIPGDKRLRAEGGQVISEVYNTRRFLTPIAELDLDRVTAEERRLYEQWRRGYENYWTGSFDPIAIRFDLADNQIGADVTVMPLIAATRYKTYVDIARGMTIKAHSGDRHAGTLAHMSLAFNADSATVQGWGMMAGALAPGLKTNPFSWIGDSISLYVDDDPIWKQFAAAEDPDIEQFPQLPIAAHIEVRSAFKLTAFLASLRAFIEQSSPGMLRWQTLKHKEMSYVKVSPSERAIQDDPDSARFALYYAPTGKSLVVSMNERTLKRSLDRQTLGREDQDAAKKQADLAPPWLGEHLNLQVDKKLLQIGLSAGRDDMQAGMQLRSWSNLPILNEWKRLYPDRDPLQVHASLWGTKLLCPGGGKYQWNENAGTMVSSVYGHPLEPKAGPAAPPALQRFDSGNFGIGFEHDGLRARMSLRRQIAR